MTDSTLSYNITTRNICEEIEFHKMIVQNKRSKLVSVQH